MKKLIEFYNKSNFKQKRLLLFSSIGFVFFISLIVAFNITPSSETENQPSEVAVVNKDAVASATKELEKAKIPFEIEQDGNKYIIKTTPELTKKAQLRLAQINISSTKLGWDNFNKSSIGKTSFENKITYLKSLEEEIALALESIDTIEEAKVNLALPKESLFVDEKKQPTASVVLSLKPETKLSQKQIKGVKIFIANSVPELLPADIQLIDQQGFPLEEDEDGGTFAKGQEQSKYQHKMEQEIQNKIVDVIAEVVGGKNNVRAQVNVSLTYDKKTSVEETYDPNSVARSEQTQDSSEKSTTKNASDKGVPGVISNIQEKPEFDNNDNSTLNEKNNATATTNYEISKKITNLDSSGYGQVLKIGTSVSFNSEPFSKQELAIITKNIEDLVKSTINYDETRGDSVSVVGAKFFVFKQKTTKDEELNNTLSLFQNFFERFGYIFSYIFAIALAFFFYKKFVIGVGEISLSDSDTSGADSALKMENEAMLLRKMKQEKAKRISEQEELEKERLLLNKQKLRDDIKNKVTTSSELSEEDKIKHEELIQNIHRNTDGKMEDISRLFEKLIDVDTKED